MKRIASTVLIVALGFLAMGSGAQATPYSMGKQVGALPRQAMNLPEARPTLAPFAFVKFCMANPDQCVGDNSDHVVDLSQDAWGEIRAINADVNSRIQPDAAKGSYDWSLEGTSGNCNDYAVQKRKALIEAGFPASALSLSVVILPEGIGHLVLTVRTNRGDFVLDNLRSEVVAWNRTGYRWIKRQSAADPKIWVTLNAAGTSESAVRGKALPTAPRAPSPAIREPNVSQRQDRSKTDSRMLTYSGNAYASPSSMLVLAELAEPELASVDATFSLRLSTFSESDTPKIACADGCE